MVSTSSDVVWWSIGILFILGMFYLFTEVGVFVDNMGQKTRVEELMWPSPPTSVGKN